MKYKQVKKHLQVELHENFNYLTARDIELLVKDADRITIDMSRTRIVDSEGVILLYRLLQQQKELILIHPPIILRDIIALLSLEKIFPWQKIKAGRVLAANYEKTA